jgi:hypothetical protein
MWLVSSVESKFKDLRKLINPAPHGARSKSNVRFDWLRQLGSVLSDPDLAVTLADKNMGFAIVDSALLRQAIDLKFNNPIFYTPFTADEARTHLFGVCTKLNSLFGKILNPEDDSIQQTIQYIFINTLDIKNPLKSPFNSINIMVKVHKGKPAPGNFRHITQSQNSPLQPLNNLVARMTNPVLTHFVPTYLRDSGQLVYLIDQIRVDPEEEIHILTSDATDLYGNLSNDAILAGLNFAYESLKPLGPTHGFTLPWHTSTFLDIMKLANENCFVSINGKIYRQRSGLPMGASAAVQEASIALGFIERSMFINRPDLTKHFILWKRYIDDLIIILRGPRSAVDEIMAIYRSETKLIWNSVIGSSSNLAPQTIPIPFLDLGIFRVGNRIFTKLFAKPFSLPNFISPKSLHPSHTHLGWIPQNLQRISRCCSLKSDFNNAAFQFFVTLRNSGFPYRFLARIFGKFKYDSERTYFLDNYHSKIPSLSEATKPKVHYDRDRLYFTIPYHPNTRVIGWTNEVNHLIDKSGIRESFNNFPRASTAWTNLYSLSTYVLEALRENHIG